MENIQIHFRFSDIFTANTTDTYFNLGGCHFSRLSKPFCAQLRFLQGVHRQEQRPLGAKFGRPTIQSKFHGSPSKLLEAKESSILVNKHIMRG